MKAGRTANSDVGGTRRRVHPAAGRPYTRVDRGGPRGSSVLPRDRLPMIADDFDSQAFPLAGPIGELAGEHGHSAREAIEVLRGLGYRGVQWSATLAGVRPRELDAGARRDLKVLLRRLGMIAAGVDLWIPAEHFADSERVDRAVAAAIEAIGLAGDLGGVPLSIRLPGGDGERAAVAAMLAAAERHGVMVADHARPPCEDGRCGIGLDPVAELAAGTDPVERVFECGSRIAVARVSDLTRSGLRAPVGGDASERRLDLVRYRVALAVQSPRCRVVADARQWGDVEAGLRQSLAAWRDAGRPVGSGS